MLLSTCYFPTVLQKAIMPEQIALVGLQLCVCVCVKEKRQWRTTDNEGFRVPERETRVRFHPDEECKQEHNVSF